MKNKNVGLLNISSLLKSCNNVLQLILIIFKTLYTQKNIVWSLWLEWFCRSHKSPKPDRKMTKGDKVFCSLFVYYQLSISDFIFYLYKIVLSFSFLFPSYKIFFFNFFCEFDKLHKCQFKKIDICKN